MFVKISIISSAVIALLTSQINACTDELIMLQYTVFMSCFIVAEVTGVNHTFMLNLRMSVEITFLTERIVALSTLVFYQIWDLNS